MEKKNSLKLIASQAEIDISGEKVKVDIFVNKLGNLEIHGIYTDDRALYYDMLNEELILYKGEDTK